jgi:hypothetical protein
VAAALIVGVEVSVVEVVEDSAVAVVVAVVEAAEVAAVVAGKCLRIEITGARI